MLKPTRVFIFPAIVTAALISLPAAFGDAVAGGYDHGGDHGTSHGGDDNGGGYDAAHGGDDNSGGYDAAHGGDDNSGDDGGMAENAGRNGGGMAGNAGGRADGGSVSGDGAAGSTFHDCAEMNYQATYCGSNVFDSADDGARYRPAETQVKVKYARTPVVPRYEYVQSAPVVVYQRQVVYQPKMVYKRRAVPGSSYVRPVYSVSGGAHGGGYYDQEAAGQFGSVTTSSDYAASREVNDGAAVYLPRPRYKRRKATLFGKKRRTVRVVSTGGGHVQVRRRARRTDRLAGSHGSSGYGNVSAYAGQMRVVRVRRKKATLFGSSRRYRRAAVRVQGASYHGGYHQRPVIYKQTSP